MNNIQVPDPGLLFKLEQLLNVRTGEDENVYLDVRIVCSDGEFLWSRLLLSSLSSYLLSLITPTDSLDSEHTIILPDINKETMQTLLHNVIASTQTVIEDVSLLKLLAVDENYFQLEEKRQNITIRGVPHNPSEVKEDEADDVNILFFDPEYKEETRSKKKKAPRKMFCKFCSLDFQSQSYSDYLDHIHSHKNSDGLFECPLKGCGKTFKSWSHLSEHYFTHDSSPKPHLCSYCSYTSITRANVRKHEVAVHEDPDRRDFECSKCSKKFKTSSNLADHMRVHGSEVIRCKDCDKTFKSQIGFQQHQRTHTGNMFACSVCGEKFQSKHSANRHQKDIHGVYSGSAPDKISKCSKKDCQAEFSSEEDYRVHVRTAHHTKAAVLICHLCTKICATRALLKQHFKQVHSSAAWATAGEHVVPASGKSSSGRGGGKSKSLLKQENKIPESNKTGSPQMHAASALETAVDSVNNSSSPKDYGCDICHKKFATCHARDKHVATHEEGQHTCPHCHVDQPSKIVLNMHAKYCKSRTDSSKSEIVIYVNDP